MNKKLLKSLIYINAAILLIILSYKGYLFFHESNFQDSNYESINRLQADVREEPYSFAVMGSAKNSIDIFQDRIIHDINADSTIAFAISTGDAVLNGAEDKYRVLNNCLKKLAVPVFLAVGGNEVSDGGDIRFYKHFGPFYYSFAYGDSYFIFVDTTGTTPLDSEKDWILSELNKADMYRCKFVFMSHSPIEPAEKNFASDEQIIADADFRNFLLNAFAAHNVTGVFSNGSTVYKQDAVNGVRYYLSGGAGGAIIEDSPDSVYHYLKVTVSANGIAVNAVKEPLSANHSVTQWMESIWFYVHSIFYVKFLDFLFAAALTLWIFFMLYKKASKSVDYYKDFNGLPPTDAELDKKLNIAMFTNNYLPFIGGVPVSIYRLANALRQRGHKVVIFAPRYPWEDDREEGVFRCKLLVYKKTNTFNFAIANIYSREMEDEFVKGKFDIVHVHHPFWMGQKGYKLGEKYHVPVILTYHTRLEMYAENLPFFKLAFKNVWSHKLIKRFAQKCDGVIAPTVSAKDYLINVGVSKPKLVMPTGLDFKKYELKDESKLAKIKSTYALGNEILICSVSRLAVEKNIPFLIKGLKLVKESTDVKFKCVLIGKGPEKEKIEKLIDECGLKNEIVLIGAVAPEDIPQYYLASDLFVFSSLSETQGMVLLEAMAGKCPVVCVRSSGTDDMIKDGYNGYKTAEDEAEWAQHVTYLLENSDVLETMSSNAFSFAQNFPVEKMAERVEAFYKKEIAAKNSLPKEAE